jgi:mRNA-degrading endonuclease RelE of RelBE toxin-antitoxin system
VRYHILLAPSAAKELRALRADIRARVRDGIQLHLRHEPTKVSKSRIKRLRGLEKPQYRLRVGDIRVFYDVEEDAVQVLAVVSKAQAEQWLKAAGIRSPAGGPSEGEG